MKKLASAGMLYFYIRGFKDKNGQMIITVIDSYKHLPDGFFNACFDIAKDFAEDIDAVNVFGVIGKSCKVDTIQKTMQKDWIENCNKELELEDITKENEYLDDAGNAFNQSVKSFFYFNPTIESKKYKLPIEDEELFYIAGGYKDNPELDKLIEEAIVLWCEKESPIFFGKQSMIRSFYLKNFIGRKLLAAIPFGTQNNFNLLFEGGKYLKLESECMYGETTPNPGELGFFLTSGVETILLNPCYALGKTYLPTDLCVEWHKVFLYACALKKGNWTIPTLEPIHKKFLCFLEENICEIMEAEPAISKEMYYETMLLNIKQYKEIIKGEDEPVISKELLQVLNTRYVYLPYILDLLDDKLDSINDFSSDLMNNKINEAISEKDNFKKGKLWEKATKYYLQHLDGLRVVGERVKAGYQEIDYSLINVSKKDLLWQMGAYILVECKNYKDNVGIQDIRNIAYICNMKGCKSAFLFTTKGITKKAQEEIIRLVQTDMNIICFTKDDLLKLKTNSDCMDLLKFKFQKLKEEVDESYLM